MRKDAANCYYWKAKGFLLRESCELPHEDEINFGRQQAVIEMNINLLVMSVSTKLAPHNCPFLKKSAPSRNYTMCSNEQWKLQINFVSWGKRFTWCCWPHSCITHFRGPGESRKTWLIIKCWLDLPGQDFTSFVNMMKIAAKTKAFNHSSILTQAVSSLPWS